ncbi:Arabinogalactan endo-1,4-beta-galactosidase [Roseateles sp. YR242]|uniref:glycoside hydrolase family 53 protein n=1 Tax=Roseateles sp. YR242 TaxID=1855305 RepID=UPI0008B932DD|nr:glycosyl hydrolase 53 family protein [Roseateles sp. YR242]SEL35779.1 Arabinogalactan endo-1,4-beta-galactosidase [Roseateles sp. YR242]
MSDHRLIADASPQGAHDLSAALTRRTLVLAGGAALVGCALPGQAAEPVSSTTAGVPAVVPAASAAAGPVCVAHPVTRHAKSFILGADVSTLEAVERGGARFSTADGRSGTALQILRASGINWARLRLWHTPVNARDVVEGDRIISRHGEPVGGGNNGLEVTLALAKRIRKQGLKLLLDIHYSDFWTDPGKQEKPAAWARLHGEALQSEVERYTSQVLTALHDQGTDPDMIQVGNEINGGMLWPDGKTWRQTPDEKIGGDQAFVDLLGAGIRGVRATDRLRGGRLPVMLHLAHQGDGKSGEMFRRVYDRFEAAKLDYDVIGLSWYPYHHDGFDQLRTNLRDLSDRYRKPLVVVETAYGWRPDNPGSGPAVFNEEGAKHGGYPATPQGQATMLRDLVQAVAAVPEGLGVFWWEPAWLDVPGAGWRTGEGNAWANQTLFDAQGRALPALKAFRDAAPCP